jgi:hypothetical protein
MNAAPQLTPSTFEAFFKLGYTRLLPIIPPGSPISPTSSLFKRLDALGKIPGVRHSNGLWSSYDWLANECDAADLRRWQAMGAGIGIRTGAGLYAIDADTKNKDCAVIIEKAVLKHFGILATRIGSKPKALYLIALSEALPYTRIEFGELNDKGSLSDRVEVLGEGRQFVAYGVHPGTKQPYSWPRPIVARDQLPVVSPAQIRAFLEELRSVLPAAKPLITEGASTSISQASLRGNLDTVRKAVAATPNTSKAFSTREAYRDFGYAIKAALPDNEPEAFEIFAEWCGRWVDDSGEPVSPGNDPDVVAADWRRMKGPFRRGASFLFELAETNNPEAFKKIDAFFDVIEEPEDLFGIKSLQKPFEPPVSIVWRDPAEWRDMTPPVRRFIVGGMVPDGEVTLLTGAGGVGKTLLAQLAATCVAQGLPFLGRPTIQSKVMLFLCEDSDDELQLRQRDINKALGLDLDVISPNMRIASRKFMDNLLAVWDRNSGSMKRTAVWHALRDDAVAFGAKLTVVDTIADTFGGNEIDRSHVRQFVQACLGKLAQDTGGAVLALGHPSKAGQAVGGDGTSGSTAWHASVRSRLYLQHATKDKTGPLRRLENMKANYGAGGDVFMLRWHRGSFDLVATKSTAPDGGIGDAAAASATAGSIGDATGGAGVAPDMGSVIDDAIMIGVAEASADTIPMVSAHNSPNYAPKVLRRRSELLAAYPMGDVEAGWQRAVKAGRVAQSVLGKSDQRRPIMGYVLTETAYTADTPNLFD